MESVTLNRPEYAARRQYLLLACVPTGFLIVVMFIITNQHNAQLETQAATFGVQLAQITATHNEQLTRIAAECNARLAAQAAEVEKRK